MAHNLARRLVFTDPFVDHLPQEPVFRPGQYFTSTTSSGRTQWTRESTSEEPNRVDRGGVTSSGILSWCNQEKLDPYNSNRQKAPPSLSAGARKTRVTGYRR